MGVDLFYDPFQDRRVGLRKHPVAQVEHVARMSAVAAQDVGHLGLYHLSRPQAHRRVQVALKDSVGTEPAAGLVQGYPPVHPDHVSSSGGHEREDLPGTDPEVDTGYIQVCEPFEDPATERQHVAFVDLRAQGPGPAVEELYGRCAVGHLRPQRGKGHIDQPVQEGVPKLGITQHQGLSAAVCSRRFPLDEVRGHGEWRTGEADQWNRPVGHHPTDRLQYVGGVLLGLQGSQALEIGGVLEGPVDDRSDSRLDLHAKAHGMGWNHDVRVENGGVNPVAPDRLESDLGRQISVGDGVQDASRSPDSPVLGK